MSSTIKTELMNQSLTTSTVGSPFTMQESSQELLAELRVSNINGATTLDVNVEHSSNGTDWHVLGSFTQLVGVNGIELLDLGKHLNRVRANTTLAGATQAADVIVEFHTSKENG